MPFNCEDLPTRSPEEFCRALKVARERKAISLSSIAKATKIPASLFAGLERNDLRFWPSGLYRRSFFRDYVRAVGLPEAELCGEFSRLFAQDHPGTISSALHTDREPATDLRLTLDTEWHAPRPPFASRVVASAIDATATLLIAVAITLLAQTPWISTTALVALVYFTLGTLFVNESPASWAVARRRVMIEALRRGSQAVANARPEPADDTAHGALDPDDSRPWITDAHRVGPAPSAQLRFRVKAS